MPVEWNQQQLKIAYEMMVNNKSSSLIQKELGVSHDAVSKVKKLIAKGNIPPTTDPEEIALAKPPTKFVKKKVLVEDSSPLGKKDEKKDNSGSTESEKAKPDKNSMLVETGAVTDTNLLKFVAHIQQVPLTVNMYVSYGCAVANGYEGNLGDWLNLISLDFWSCRGRNMFAEFGESTIYGGNGKKPEVEQDGVAAG